MLTLFNVIREIGPETPDTGTYADGAAPIAASERSAGRAGRDWSRSSFQRDYGTRNAVRPEGLGYC